MSKIYWMKSNGELDLQNPPPFPNYNMLENEIINNSACYVSINMRNKTLEIHEQATAEILKLIDQKYKEISELKKENKEQKEIISKLTSQLKKWTDQQEGRKKILNYNQKNQILEWKNEKLSNREIAKKLQVSEGTIRNFLKSQEAYND